MKGALRRIIEVQKWKTMEWFYRKVRRDDCVENVKEIVRVMV